MAAKGTPSLSSGVDRQTRLAIEKLAEVADTGAGLRGKPEDRYIRVGDLIDMGLAKRLAGNAQRLVAGQNLISGNAPILDIPPRPEGLTANGGISVIFLTWSNPNQQYANHSLTEIWRSETDDIGTATLIGQTAISFIFPDGDVDFTKTYYYWIRFVSSADISGPFNAAAGTQGQCKQDPAELLELLAGEITASQLHADLLEPIELITAPGGLVEQSIANANAIADEIMNRADAITAEAEARAAAILAEATARGAAITAEQNIRQTADESLAEDIALVTAANGTNAAAILTEATTRANADLAISSQIALLSAGSSNQFDHTDIWYFDSSVEGWTSNGGTPTTTAAGWLRPFYSSDTTAISPVIAVDGTKYTQIRARIRKVGSPSWDGRAFYVAAAFPSFNGTNLVIISEPTYDVNGIALLTWNMDAAPGWVGSTLTRIRLDLGQLTDASNYFEIDWVAIGRPSPGASSAELLALGTAMTTADSALASDITAANTAIAGKASSAALSAVEARVTDVEGDITSQSSILNNVKAALTGSGNLVKNSDFDTDSAGWRFTKGGDSTIVATGRNNFLTLPGVNTLGMEVNTAAGSGSKYARIEPPSGIANYVPGIKVGKRYCASAHFAKIGATSSARIFIQFFTAAGVSISAPFVSGAVVDVSSVVAIGDMTRLSIFAVAPATAAYASVLMQLDTVAGSSGDKLVIAQPMLEEVSAEQTLPSPYSAGVAGLRAADAANAAATSLLDARVVATENSITAQATSLTNLTSSLFPNAIFKNPTFVDWPTSSVRPTGWSDFGGIVVPTRHTGAYAYAGGNSVQFITGANQAGMQFVNPAAQSVDAAYVDIELVFTVTAGSSLAGAGVLVRWVATDATNAEYAVKLNDLFPAGTITLNKKYTVNVRGKKPTVIGKTFSHNQVYLMANHNGSGLGALTSKTIIFDSLLVSVSDASADAVSLLETRVTAAEGVNTTQAGQITTLNTNVAGKASNTALSALTSRVAATENDIAAANADITYLGTEVEGKASSAALTSLSNAVSVIDGQVTANALAVTQVQASLPGSGNLIATDTEFRSDTSGWVLGGNTTGKTVNVGRLISDSDAYRIRGTNNLQVSVTGSQTSGLYFEIQLFANQIPVEVGKRYCFSAYAAAHRCNGTLMIWWINSAGGLIDVSPGAAITATGGQDSANWARETTAVLDVAPTNAVYARLVFRATTTTASDPFIWLCKPMFSEVPAATTVVPAYSAGGATSTIAAVKITAEAAANDADSAIARWEVKTTVGDLTGGVGFYNDGSVTRFGIHADQFFVYSPGKAGFGLIVDGTRVVMDGAFIKDATISSAAITDLSVTKLVGDTANFVKLNVGTLYVDDIQGDVDTTISAPVITGVSLSGSGVSPTVVLREVVTLNLPSQVRPRIPLIFSKARHSVASTGTYLTRYMIMQPQSAGPAITMATPNAKSSDYLEWNILGSAGGSTPPAGFPDSINGAEVAWLAGGVWHYGNVSNRTTVTDPAGPFDTMYTYRVYFNRVICRGAYSSAVGSSHVVRLYGNRVYQSVISEGQQASTLNAGQSTEVNAYLMSLPRTGAAASYTMCISGTGTLERLEFTALLAR